MTAPKTFEELQEMLEHPERFDESGNKKKAKTTGKAKGAPNKPGYDFHGQVYAEMHFFLREHSNWNDVLADSRDEANVRNSNVLVFAHNHAHDEECVKSCKWIIKGDSDDDS